MARKIKRTGDKTETEKFSEEVVEVTEEDAQILNREIFFDKVLSTGSTLLDLAISGSIVRGGGVPGGIILEVFGPSGAGKTALLAELAGSAQTNGGSIRFDDPEARFNKEYSRIYGVDLEADDYERPDTVKEMFQNIKGWKPEPKVEDAINVSCEDSLAALSTEMEMEDADKMGMKRAKDFSEGLRKICRLIANNNWLIACSNQERDSTTGKSVTSGGKGIPYYASLRIRTTPVFPSSAIVKTKTINGKQYNKTIGIKSTCTIKKSSIDEPYRTAPIYIIFKYGIDDVRANLQWLKDFGKKEKVEKGEKSKRDKYVFNGEEFSLIEAAIKYVEDNDLIDNLRELVIDTWEEIEELFKVKRKSKRRR